MSPLTGYRRLFGLTGPLYVVVGFLARLPLAMSQLGTLLLVAGTTDIDDGNRPRQSCLCLRLSPYWVDHQLV